MKNRPEIASDEARESFANAVLNGERERLSEQPSKSSSHRLAQQQALGKLAEIVFHSRRFLTAWGKAGKVEDFGIWVKLKTEDGEIIQHGIGLTPLLAAIEPAGIEIAESVQTIVHKGLRNASWSLACLSKEVAEVHAFLEQEMLKEPAEGYDVEHALPPDDGVTS